MPISEQRCRKRGGRAEARGAKSKIQASRRVGDIIREIDEPTPKRKPYKPGRYELDHMITQAHEAMTNHPDSVSAKRRYEALLAYKKENFGGSR